MADRGYVSVVIPALNEARHIADVVGLARRDPATAEVIVVDDSSIDDTAMLAQSAGARVVRSSMLGKGDSMRDGVEAAECEIVVYLDGDLSGLRAGIVGELAAPIADDRADFVKARFGRTGGRVTELTAKPMLRVFFPELAHFAQPLGGIIAARRKLLRSLQFEDGYGVDIGLLIDAQRCQARICEVDIGTLIHDSQALLDLAAMANEVARVIYLRARTAGRLNVEQVGAMFESQRQAAAELDYVLTRRRGRTRLLLLAMDGLVTPARFIEELARATGREAELQQALLTSPSGDVLARTRRVANLFRFVHQSDFVRVARALPLRDGAIEFVNRLRRLEFMVGLVTDGWFIGAEIVRRRVFADFAVAHTLRFESGVCSGDLRFNPAFLPDTARQDDLGACRSHVLTHLLRDSSQPPWEAVWVVGDPAVDLELMRRADRAFTLGPAGPASEDEPPIEWAESFDALMTRIQVGPSNRIGPAEPPAAAHATQLYNG